MNRKESFSKQQPKSSRCMITLRIAIRSISIKFFRACKNETTARPQPKRCQKYLLSNKIEFLRILLCKCSHGKQGLRFSTPIVMVLCHEWHRKIGYHGTIHHCRCNCCNNNERVWGSKLWLFPQKGSKIAVLERFFSFWRRFWFCTYPCTYCTFVLCEGDDL